MENSEEYIQRQSHVLGPSCSVCGNLEGQVHDMDKHFEWELLHVRNVDKREDAP